MRVKCLAQEHNTMSLARAQTWTTRSGVERTNHIATAPPHTCIMKGKCFCQKTYIYLIIFNPLMPAPPVTAHDEL